jgi:hypothetical protein
MSPLAEGNILKQFAEKLQINIKVGGRDTYLTQQAPTVPDLLEEASAVEPKALPEVTVDSGAAASVVVEMPNSIAVIKAWDLLGTSRVQIEFAVLNNTDAVQAVRDVVLLVGAGDTPDAVRFKQFVDVGPQTREPSATRLPVILAPHAGRHLCAELEGTDVTFGRDSRECELVVSVHGERVGYKFLAHANPVLDAILNDLIQKRAVETVSAIAFQLPTSMR